MAQKGRQCDISSFTEDKVVFSNVRARLQHALLCKKIFFFGAPL